jgi:XRE family aerobic/anaerobic benzoate catabolism transcriptional regulator
LTDRDIETEIELLQKRLGDKVRKARSRTNMSRRVLGEKSGVSARYLAQLESGTGNISVALLHRVARALDLRTEWLLAEEDPWNSEVVRMSELFRQARREERDKVIELLEPAVNPALRSQRVCLIGLRGAGKSTLGAAVSKLLGVPFIELSQEIEDRAGMPVAEVVALYGQDEHRKVEWQMLRRVVANHDQVILAVPGNIVANPDTYDYLLAHFHSVWVRAQPEEHMLRVRAQGDTRMFSGSMAPVDQLKAILQSREKLYAKAEAELDTSSSTVAASMRELARLIQERRFIR